jgi:hypothetical protein
MRFTVPINLGDYVKIRATGEQCKVVGVAYQNGSIGNTFYMDCFSIYTDRGIFALQELAKVTSHTEADNYVDEHSV